MHFRRKNFAQLLTARRSSMHRYHYVCAFLCHRYAWVCVHFNFEGVTLQAHCRRMCEKKVSSLQQNSHRRKVVKQTRHLINLLLLPLLLLLLLGWHNTSWPAQEVTRATVSYSMSLQSCLSPPGTGSIGELYARQRLAVSRFVAAVARKASDCYCSCCVCYCCLNSRSGRRLAHCVKWVAFFCWWFCCVYACACVFSDAPSIIHTTFCLAHSFSVHCCPIGFSSLLLSVGLWYISYPLSNCSLLLLSLFALNAQLHSSVYCCLIIATAYNCCRLLLMFTLHESYANIFLSLFFSLSASFALHCCCHILTALIRGFCVSPLLLQHMHCVRPHFKRCENIATP